MNKLFVLIPLAASMCFGASVGVLKNTSKCPGEQVTIDLDVEEVFIWARREIPIMFGSFKLEEYR